MAIEFINPEDLLKETEAIMGQIANVALFRNPQYQKILESWCAGMYGWGYKKYFEDCAIGINNSAIRLDGIFFLEPSQKNENFKLWRCRIRAEKEAMSIKASRMVQLRLSSMNQKEVV